MGGFEFSLRVATGAGSCIGWESEAVEDGAEGQNRDDQDGQLKITELGRRGGMSSGVGDEAQGDGAYGDSHA
jgi:hypothetical protein